jgi:endonuclease-3
MTATRVRSARAATRPLPLTEAVETLRLHHGRQEPPPTADPFELVLWENVAYLAPVHRRREAFELLRATVGTSPAAILAASRRSLEAVTARGILKATFAAKLRECARIARDELGGDLAVVGRMPIGDAKRALRRFPGIGEPGAEKILLFSGRTPLLAPDSNALRVLGRLGIVREATSYAKTYAAAREAAAALPRDTRVVQQAHLLLQRHGRILCTRTAPRCLDCPLAPRCPHGRRHAGSAGGARAKRTSRAGGRSTPSGATTSSRGSSPPSASAPS